MSSAQSGFDAINLIHQAFESGYQGELARQKQVSDIALAQEASKRANEELGLHKQVAESTLKTQLAQLQQMHFENQAKIAELAGNNLIPSNTTPNYATDAQGNNTFGTDAFGNPIPGGSTPQSITKGPITFGGETIQGNQYLTPQEKAQQGAAAQSALISGTAPAQAAAAALTTKAQSEAEEPFKEQASTRQVAGELAVQAPKLAQEKEIAAAAQAGETTRTNIIAKSTIAGHQIEASAQKYVAELNNMMTPEQQASLVPQIQRLTGGVGKLPSGKDGEIITRLANASGLDIPDSKDIDTIKGMPLVVDTIKAIKKFNQQYGTNNKVRAYLNGKILDETQLPVDARTALDAIHSRSIPLAKVTGELQSSGRVTVQQLNIVNNAMAEGGASYSQNGALLKNLQDLANSATSRALGPYSPIQRDHILKTQGLDKLIGVDGKLKAGVTDPTIFDDIPETNSAGKKLDRQQTLQNYVTSHGKIIPAYN